MYAWNHSESLRSRERRRPGMEFLACILFAYLNEADCNTTLHLFLYSDDMNSWKVSSCKKF